MQALAQWQEQRLSILPAQVHPRKLTLALIKAARLCQLRQGTVTGVSTSAEGAVIGGPGPLLRPCSPAAPSWHCSQAQH